MTYVPEQATEVLLNFSIGPYGVPLDPLAVSLDFADGSSGVGLPWALPTLVVEFTAPIQKAGQSFGLSRIPITKAGRADLETRGSWGAGFFAPASVALVHENAISADRETGATFGDATGFDSDVGIHWQDATPEDSEKRAVWGWGTVKDRRDWVASWNPKPRARDIVPAFAWYTVNLTGTVYDDAALIRALLQTDGALSVSLAGFGEPYTPREWNDQAFAFGYQVPKRPIVPHDQTVRVTARQASTRDNDKRISWGFGQSAWQDWNLPYPVEDNAPPPEPIDPPERRTVYLIMNTLQITDVATGTPLDVQNVRISLDIDSISWQFTGTLYGQGSLALVQPDNQGMKDIQVIINGHTWVFAIERYTSDERFPTKKFNITGVSRTQYMASPFAPARSYTTTLATTAAQAATSELQNTGFTLSWPTSGDATLSDWPIPAGALSYRDKSPAQVIAQIVKTAGGVMVPNLASDGWTIQPRYKVPPWDWDSATPDAEIYIGMIRSRSAQYEPGHAYNACYVSGITQGVAVDVHRQGSGGTDPMPDIFDDLITDPQPAISRGRNELAATGPKVIENLEVIIPEQAAAPGVLVPGMLAKVTHDNPDQDYWALVLGNSLAANGAGGAAVYQTVTLERTA